MFALLFVKMWVSCALQVSHIVWLVVQWFLTCLGLMGQETTWICASAVCQLAASIVRLLWHCDKKLGFLYLAQQDWKSFWNSYVFHTKASKDPSCVTGPLQSMQETILCNMCMVFSATVFLIKGLIRLLLKTPVCMSRRFHFLRQVYVVMWLFVSTRKPKCYKRVLRNTNLC